MVEAAVERSGLGGMPVQGPGGAFQRLLTTSDICNVAKSVIKIYRSTPTTCEQVLHPPDHELVLLA